MRNQKQPSRRHATSARQLTHAQRRLGPRPGSKYNPGAARPAPASDFAHARRHLGPRPGRGCAPEPHSQPSPDDLRTRGDAWARGSGGAVALGATPHRNLARSSGGGGGVGRGGSPLGRSESGRLLAWLPPPAATSYAIPYVLTTTQARATSAPPPRSPLLPAAAMSWRLPLK